MRRVKKKKIEEEKFQCPIEREILSLIVVVVFLSLKFPPFYFYSYFYYFQCNNTLLNYFTILCDFFRFYISFQNLLCCLLLILSFHIFVEFSYTYYLLSLTTDQFRTFFFHTVHRAPSSLSKKDFCNAIVWSVNLSSNLPHF